MLVEDIAAIKNGRLIARDRDPEEKWITIKGHHVLVSGSGEILQGGFPGMEEGKKIETEKKEKTKIEEWRERTEEIERRLAQKYQQKEKTEEKKEKTKTYTKEDDAAFESGKIKSFEDFHGGINTVFKGEIDGGGTGLLKFVEDEKDVEVLREYESELDCDLRACPQAHREVLASKIDQILGLGIVPLTVIKKDSKKGIGSCQRFVDGLEEGQIPKDDLKGKEQAFQAAVFDKIIGSADRHGANYGLDSNGSVVLIDNGLSFVGKPQKSEAGDYDKFVLGFGFDMKINSKTIPPGLQKEIKKQTDKIVESKAQIDSVFREFKLPEKEQKAFWKRVGSLQKGKWSRVKNSAEDYE